MVIQKVHSLLIIKLDLKSKISSRNSRMRKTRSRGTRKRHSKRHTRRRGGENSPNPAAGAPARDPVVPTPRPIINTNLSKGPARVPKVQVTPIDTPNNAKRVVNYTSLFRPGNTGYYLRPRNNIATREAIQGKINRLADHTNPEATAAARQRGLNEFYARQAKEQANYQKLLKSMGL